MCVQAAQEVAGALIVEFFAEGAGLFLQGGASVGDARFDQLDVGGRFLRVGMFADEGGEDAEVVVIAEEIGEALGLFGEGGDLRAVDSRKEFEFVAQVLGAFAPLVQGVVGGIVGGGLHGAAALFVDFVEPAFDRFPPFSFQRPLVHARVRFAEGFDDAGDGVIALECRRAGFAAAVEEGAAEPGEFSGIEAAVEMFRERVERIDEDLGVADGRERAARVAIGAVLAVEGFFAELAADEAKRSADFLEALADVVNGVVGDGAVGILEGRQRAVDAFADDPPDGARDRLALLQLKGHISILATTCCASSQKSPGVRWRTCCGR